MLKQTLFVFEGIVLVLGAVRNHDAVIGKTGRARVVGDGVVRVLCSLQAGRTPGPTGIKISSTVDCQQEFLDISSILHFTVVITFI